MQSKITYKPYGAKAILLEWPPKIEESILEEIIAIQHQINKKEDVVDSIVGYHSLTIIYNHPINFNIKVNELKRIHQNSFLKNKKNKQHWQIPVCYDIEFGIDLKEMANKKNLSVKEIIEIHTQGVYTIFFIGFLPGFPYLSGLDARLFCDRRAVPRKDVPKGAVGIGGMQTGIYPQASAGGWNIIGNSPVSLFNVNDKNPCKLQSGDQLQFFSISKVEYLNLMELQQKGTSIIKKVIHD